MEGDIMGDQLKRLYDAITFLGEGKKHADKIQFQLDQYRDKIEVMNQDKEIINSELQSALVERNKNQNDLKEVVRTMKKMQEDKEKLVTLLKEKMNALDLEAKTFEMEAKKWNEEFNKADKQVKALQNERDKMRQRI
mmetsp:Transcript_25638/g.24937  ORF Transcript_25638/g.24937 Transcript_25638/m.24937 type:complete len:137 (+) Transcript_25638:1226-1636(+)